MTIVTSGSKYMDIDAFACCFAYQKLLECFGENSIVLSSAPVNQSVIPELQFTDFNLSPNYSIQTNDYFAVMDVSNPDYFEKFVVLDRINAIFDHHTGFEDFWKSKLGKSSNIEFIGAAATLIFEEFEKNQLLAALNTELIKLLMAAILDNTLNFTAKITTVRDQHAYQQLERMLGKTNFAAEYFMACQRYISCDLFKSLENDIKHISNNRSNHFPEYIGQLTVWDVVAILDRIDEVVKYFSQLEAGWMLNLICLKENRSYIIANDIMIMSELENIFNGIFVGHVMILEHSILRKEIIKKH